MLLDLGLHAWQGFWLQNNGVHEQRFLFYVSVLYSVTSRGRSKNGRVVKTRPENSRQHGV